MKSYTETIKCANPKCRIGQDINMKELEDAIVSSFFWAGFRVCPNCGTENTVHKTGNLMSVYRKPEVEVPF